jgi:ribosomal protein S18 acetylase RimI-like enzyme
LTRNFTPPDTTKSSASSATATKDSNASSLPDAAPPAWAIGYSAHLSKQEYTVRAAQPAEAPAILDLWHAARSTHATTPDRIEYVHRLLTETPGSLLVADAGSALLGTLIAAWDGWRGNMYRLVVLREHRRRGIGLALVRTGEEHLRRQGANRITALVAHEDEIASAFWESAGYPQDRPIGRRVRSL